MFTSHSSRRNVALAAGVFSLTSSLFSGAESIESFATGDYAPGLRSHEMMAKIEGNARQRRNHVLHGWG